VFSDFKILFRRCPGFLVEGVKDVDCLHAPRYVNHTISAARFEDANLFHTLADGGHRLEIVGLAAALDLIELITRVMPRVVGEVSQALQRISKKAHGPHCLIISSWIYRRRSDPQITRHFQAMHASHCRPLAKI
jgi:hypothetical protein